MAAETFELPPMDTDPENASEVTWMMFSRLFCYLAKRGLIPRDRLTTMFNEIATSFPEVPEARRHQLHEAVVAGGLPPAPGATKPQLVTGFWG